MNKNQRFLSEYVQSLVVAASPKTPTTAANGCELMERVSTLNDIAL